MLDHLDPYVESCHIWVQQNKVSYKVVPPSFNLVYKP